jgi:hypothetical protein
MHLAGCFIPHSWNLPAAPAAFFVAAGTALGNDEAEVVMVASRDG